jgi:hypothetical protein
MGKIINKKWSSVISLSCATALLLSVSAPAASAAVKGGSVSTPSINTDLIESSVSTPSINTDLDLISETQETTPLSEKEMEKRINEAVAEILAEAPEQNASSSSISKKSGEYETLAGGTLAVKLAKYFGKSYVKTKIPKKIYKAFPESLTDNVSESQWLTIWNTYILMGPLDHVKSTVADALKPYVWDWVATSCGVIAQGVVWALI